MLTFVRNDAFRTDGSDIGNNKSLADINSSHNVWGLSRPKGIEKNGKNYCSSRNRLCGIIVGCASLTAQQCDCRGCDSGEG